MEDLFTKLTRIIKENCKSKREASDLIFLEISDNSSKAEEDKFFERFKKNLDPKRPLQNQHTLEKYIDALTQGLNNKKNNNILPRYIPTLDTHQEIKTRMESISKKITIRLQSNSDENKNKN